MHEHASFGEWVRRRRKTLDLTQQALADRIGCSKVTVVKIESDQRRPSRQVAALLADALQIPPAEQAAFIRAARGEQAAFRLSAPTAAPAAAPWPEPPTPLLGRQAELAEIERLLTDPACRLLTLVGPGGIGKTRLALETARRMSARPTGAGWTPAEVRFVALAPVRAGSALAPAVAEALAFTFHGRAPVEQQLLDTLRGRSLLLVLDNFEHLVGQAAFLAEIVTWAPGVKLLLTSRERLRLRAEWVLEVQGLPVAAEEPGEALSEAALALFEQAAQRGQPGFRLAAGERAAVRRLCRLVEGLPLAIELAAAWAGLLSCAEIAAEVERSLGFLDAAPRDLPERQRGLRAVFAHSWGLLSSAEQNALQRLAVFRGPFRREAAEAVAAATPAVLAALRDKSLLRRAAGERFDLHELVRQFAAERLEAAPDQRQAALARLADYYAAQLAAWELDLQGPAQLAALAALALEFETVLSVWEYWLQAGAAGDLARGFYCLWFFCEVRGRHAEGEVLFGQAVAALRGADPGAEAALGRALAYQAWFALYQGRPDQARHLLEESLSRLRSGADPHALAEALFTAGSESLLRGRYAEAVGRLQESLALGRAEGRPGLIALALAGLGTLHLVQGQAPAAYTVLTEAVTQARAAGAPSQLAACLGGAGTAAGYLGQAEEARLWIEESLELYRGLHHQLRVAKAQSQLGLLALAQSDGERAEALLRESEAVHREVGERSGLAVALNQLGRALTLQGRAAEAWRAHVEAAQLAAAVHSAHPWLEALVSLAEAVAPADEATRALVARLCAHPACQGEVRARAEALAARLGASEGPDDGAALETLAAAWLRRPAPA